MTKEVTTETFDKDVLVLSSDKPVLVDFWAPWCGPCRSLSPVVDQIGKENDHLLTVVKVNIDEEPELAERYDILSIPNLVLFHKGEDVAGHMGLASKENIMASFEDYL